MAPETTFRKRKAVTYDVPETSDMESDAEFGDSLEGILSESEDSDNGSADAGSGDEGDGDLEELSVLESDDVPSEEDTGDGEDQDGGRAKSNGTDAVEEDSVAQRFGVETDEDKPNYTVVTDANGSVRYVYDEIDPVYDSDDSDAPVTNNTIGNIPLSFYDSYPHIGYDINGKRIMRPAKGEALDALLDSIDIPKGWTGLTDPATGKPLNLSQDELEILRRIQTNELPEEGYDPYPVSFVLGKVSKIWTDSLGYY